MNPYLPFHALRGAGQPDGGTAEVTTLYCLPHAGGAASAYRRWRELFPRRVDVQPVQLPGREGLLRQPPAEGFGALVDVIGTALAPDLAVPYALFGHSMGAILAAELAAWLMRRGYPMPMLLVVSARGGAPDPTRPPLRPDQLVDDDVVVRHVLGLGGTDPAVFLHPELREITIRTTRADLALCADYRRTYERLPIPILALGGREDREVPAESLAAWQRHTSASFRQVVLPGGHFFLRGQTRETVDLIVAELAQHGAPTGKTDPAAALPVPPPSVIMELAAGKALSAAANSMVTGGAAGEMAAGAGTPTPAALLVRRARRRAGRATVPAHWPDEPDLPAGAAATRPLSGPQWSVWLHGKLHRRTREQLVTWIGRLTGEVDAPALAAALTEAARRHPALRTTVGLDGFEPVLRIADALGDVRLVELPDVPAPERERAALALLRERWEAVDPERGPAFVATVVPVAARVHLLGVAVHHVVFDGRSLRLLLDDVARRYAGQSASEASAASRAPGRPAGAIRFWTDLLADAPWLALPRTPPAEEPGRYRLPLDRGTARRIRSTATRYRATPFMVVLAALALRLRPYSAAPDLVIGTPVDIRPAERVSEIGCFANTLPLRIRWLGTADETFADIVDGVRRRMVDALAHRDVPIVEIAEALRKSGRLRHYPLFDVVFNYIDKEFEELRLPGAGCEVVDTVGGTAEFGLMVTVHDDGDEIELVLEPRPDAFDRAAIRRFARDLAGTIAAVTAAPDAPVAAALAGTGTPPPRPAEVGR